MKIEFIRRFLVLITKSNLLMFLRETKATTGYKSNRNYHLMTSKLLVVSEELFDVSSSSSFSSSSSLKGSWVLSVGGGKESCRRRENFEKGFVPLSIASSFFICSNRRFKFR